MIDLDHNATTKPSPGVIAAITRGLTDFYHNPSSVHRAGQAARQQIELARADIAHLIGAKAREVTFCSGGTEAINLVIRGVVDAWGGSARHGDGAGAPSHNTATPTILSTRVEHAAVRELLESLEKTGRARVRWASISREGFVDLDALDALLPGCALASIQWANNETGTIQPIEAIAARCRTHRVPLHVDGTQWVGKEPTNVSSLNADFLTFSPHKFHGPKGVGVLWSRAGARLRPQVPGAQELGRRGGTENVPGIMGAGVAAREAIQWLDEAAARSRQGSLRDRFERAILDAIPDASVNGSLTHRLWNTTNIAFPRLEAEALLMILSEQGLCASAGAACSSGSLDPSPVLLAMGIPPELAHGSLRFSLGRETTRSEIDAAATIVIEAVRRLRNSMPAPPKT